VTLLLLSCMDGSYVSVLEIPYVYLNPKYVDETGCKEHGKFRVKIQKHSRDIVHIEVTFQFGLTELIVSAKQKGTERRILLLLLKQQYHFRVVL
jgi:hypothetical protein